MRSHALAIVVAFVSSTNAQLVGFSPFAQPFEFGDQSDLAKRQACPSNYNSCAGLGDSSACCAPDTNCARDQAGNVACCPFNAACTGAISGTATGSITSTTSGFVLGGTTTSTDVLGPPTTVNGVFGGGSTVPNAPYPFVYIPTSYTDAALCSQYYTSCQSESASCFASLGGQINGVTVAGGGSGITVGGAVTTTIPAASASSICSVLSASACYGLQPAACTQFQTGTNGVASATFAQAAPPRMTAGPRIMYAMGAGAVVGAAGQFI